MNPAHKNELDRLFAEAKDGVLLVSDVIKAARPLKSVLHSWHGWTWDKNKGFEENLKNQARKLLGEYFVVVERVGGEPIKTRNFVSLTIDRHRGGGYRGVRDVLSQEELTQRMVADALADLELFAAKYRRLKELAGVMAEIDKLLEREQQAKRKQKRRKPPTQPSAAA